jgi:hypothetical protein
MWLGNMYTIGLGVPKNPSRAEQAIKRHAIWAMRRVARVWPMCTQTAQECQRIGPAPRCCAKKLAIWEIPKCAATSRPRVESDARIAPSMRSFCGSSVISKSGFDLTLC